MADLGFAPFSVAPFGRHVRNRPRVAFEPTATGVKLRLVNVPRGAVGPVVLEGLTSGGTNRLGEVAAAPANLVTATTFPRSAVNGGVLANVQADDLEPGVWYHLQYTITGQSAGAYPFLAAGAPVLQGTPLPRGIGSHGVLVQIEDGFDATGVVELIRASGSITVSSVAFYKAEWDLDLSGAREWSAKTNPGAQSGVTSATIVPVAAGGTLTTGEYLTLTYEIIEATNVTEFFVPNAGSPFDYMDLPKTPGIHTVQLRVDSEVTLRANLMKLSGTIKFGFISLRQAGAGRAVAAQISIGGRVVSGSTMGRLPGVWHVAGSGSDVTGTGAPDAPFRTPERAMKFAGVAETIYLRKGRFRAFDVTVSGLSEAQRFKVTALPGEERLPVVVGHGLKEAASTGNYFGVRVREVNFVEVSNLTLGYCKKEGVLLQGQEPANDVGLPPAYGGHLVFGNRIRQTGSSAVMVCGFYPGKRIGIGNAETEVVRIQNCRIAFNDISKTNVANDYNATFQNADDLPGGNNEAVSVCCAYLNVITEWNDIHDTLQYGVDYKSGGAGGAICYNRIWNCTNHGIYIETGRRFVRDLDVHDNIIWRCRNGIVLAREADYDTEPGPIADFQMEFRNIRIWNNVIFLMDRDGIAASPHHGDHYSGTITGIRILFNTIVDCGQEEGHHYRKEVRLSGWTGPEWLAAGVLSDFVVAGNLVWRRDGEPGVLDEFSGSAGVTIAENFNFTGAVDPMLTAEDLTVTIGAGDYLVAITFPDFALRAGSPAAAMVNGRSAAPYNLNAANAARPDPAPAGAFGMAA